MFVLIVLMGTDMKGVSLLLILYIAGGSASLWKCNISLGVSVSLSQAPFSFAVVNYRITQSKINPGIINWEICIACWGGWVLTIGEEKCIQYCPSPFVFAFPYWLKPHHSSLLQIALLHLISLLPCHLFNVFLAGLMI